MSRSTIIIEMYAIALLFAITAIGFVIGTANAWYKKDNCWPYGLAISYSIIFSIASFLIFII